MRHLFLSFCLYCLTLSLAFLASLASPAFANPGNAGKPYKVMMLLYRGTTDAEKGFMNYFKRRQIPVEFIIRDAQANTTKIAEFIQEAKTLKPDLIYTFGTTLTVQVVGVQDAVDPTRHITDIPVVFNIVADPVGAGLVKNLQSSNRNLTGASHLVPLKDQINALQSMRPTQRLGVIYNPLEKNSTLAIQELQALAPQLKLKLHLAPILTQDNKQPGEEELHKAINTLLAGKPQFVYIPSDSFLIRHAKIVAQNTHAVGIPVFSATEAPIRNEGALLGLVSTYFNVGEFAAYKAEQILVNKTAPARIPVEVLHRFTYLVNMTSAKQLKIYPPLSVLKIAELISPPSVIDASE